MQRTLPSRLRTPLAIGLIGATLAACSTSPLGRNQLAFFSDEELQQMGQQSFAQYQQELPEVGGATYDYVQCVADAITEEVPADAGIATWEVKVFKDDSANAFALPGGYIGGNWPPSSATKWPTYYPTTPTSACRRRRPRKPDYRSCNPPPACRVPPANSSWGCSARAPSTA